MAHTQLAGRGPSQLALFCLPGQIDTQGQYGTTQTKHILSYKKQIITELAQSMIRGENLRLNWTIKRAYNSFIEAQMKSHTDWICQQEKFLLTPMGVLAPMSAQTRHSAQPPTDISGNVSAHESAKLPLTVKSVAPTENYRSQEPPLRLHGWNVKYLISINININFHGYTYLGSGPSPRFSITPSKESKTTFLAPEMGLHDF